MTKFTAIVRNSLIIASAVIASAPAFAQSADAPVAKVGYSDIDLSSANGQHRLHNRLVGAAREVCEAQIQSDSMVQPAHTACMHQAMARADADFALLVSKTAPQVAIADKGSSRLPR